VIYLIVKFKTKKLEKILSNDRLLQKEFGKLSVNIKRRMSEFLAAPNLSYITHKPPPRRHKLSGYPNRFAVDISKNFRIEFESTSEKLLDPIDIVEIIIVKIGDYH